ncbi:chromate efflux transporter [Dyella lutea]|uniref:Chromate efflux transporter n=1 Tax=Dyella lutea TaxID=2950441 RepID=A0ABT1FHZ8_9GAMM|nr:chromate efflux transporter [Dyella lutea]MCP1375753.1 chromate efflux transporter [Dyella lutea]
MSEASTRGRAGEVAAAFLLLGLTSFGGPVAHIGYFRRAFVERRRWLDEEHFGQLLALSQFLPGPASSQLGFSIGLLRAGWLGGLAAFAAFTLPSALLMFGFALASRALDGVWGHALVHGLKLVAVAVVAYGVYGMARTLTPDWTRRAMALLAALAMLVLGVPWMQLVLVAGGALLGPWLCRGVMARRGETFALGYGHGTGVMLIGLFALGLGVAFAPGMPPLGQVAAAFYRTGALVFGGGHVVLPLLKASVVDPGWLDNDSFLTGYGAAQAVPGPMFSLAAFLGTRLPDGMGGALGAMVAVLAIFGPGLLLVAGVLPFWRVLAQRAGAARALAGVNAVVVGLLAAALVTPVATSALHAPLDWVIAAIGVLMLARRWPPLAVVAWCVATTLGVALA